MNKTVSVLSQEANAVAKIELPRVEQERIRKYRERFDQSSSCFKYSIREEKVSDNATRLRLENDLNTKKEFTEKQKYDLQLAALYAVTGSSCEEFGRISFAQTIAACFPDGYDRALVANAMNGALRAMAPEDEIEGMLVQRLLVLQNQLMHYMGQVAVNGKNDQIVDLNINRVAKLTRLFNETLEVLNRHRRRGEQKVTVQHVNVNSGGKAIVGSQITQGGGEQVKTEGAPHAN